jgi:hypothetical protein
MDGISMRETKITANRYAQCSAWLGCCGLDVPF